MVRYIGALILLCLYLKTEAQSSNHLPLSLNEKFPDITIGEFTDRPENKIKLSQFKGKLVILDFWSITCSSCISKMPLMDSLQQAFKDKIQIILVTYNSEKDVDKLFQRIKIKKPALPSIVGDTILHKVFPHNSVPHHVWVDQHGMIKYITDAKYASFQNIEAVLAGKQMNFRFKSEFGDFDRNASLWQEGGGRLNHLVKYYSLIMEHVNEYGGSSTSAKVDSFTSNFRIRIVNNTVIDLYKFAFSNLFSGEYLTTQHNNPVPDSRVIVEAQQTNNSFPLDSIFCYESSIGLDKQSKAYSIMQKDLNHFFPYYGIVENRKVKSWVLVETSIPKNQKLIPISKKSNYQSTFTTTIELISFLSNYLKHFSFKEPAINGTDSSTKINLVLDFTSNDFTGLRTQLQHYGFDIVLQEKNLPMLIIKNRLLSE